MAERLTADRLAEIRARLAEVPPLDGVLGSTLDDLCSASREVERFHIWDRDRMREHDARDGVTECRAGIHGMTSREREDVVALLAEVERLQSAIQSACEIIELGDQRLLASDGPAGGQPPDLSLAEWRTLYVTLDRARAAEGEA